MYVPATFSETDHATLFDFIEQHSFAVLISLVDGEVTGSHIPLLIDRRAGRHGELIGHLARANPQSGMTDGK